MEGYANVDNSPEDFDDLDIEGRNARIEDISDDEDVFDEKNDERRLLSHRVKVGENTYGYVFSLKLSGGVTRWKCHLCDVLIAGQEHVDAHIQTKKHQLKVALPLHPRSIFRRIENIASTEEIPQLAPGEPVPPGFEDVVKRVGQIQATLDSYKKTALIGLEYLVELTPDERGKEPLYVCMLCDKKGDPRVAMAHITSFNHCSKYVGIHFPTANRLLNSEFPKTKLGKKTTHTAMTHLCKKIEERYGRLKPVVVDKDFFEKNKDEIRKQIENDKHFRETSTVNFLEYLTKEAIDALVPVDDPPVPADERPTIEDEKSTFIKGKITCDRSRLRIHNFEDGDEEDVFKKLAELERKAEESQRADSKTSGEAGGKGLKRRIESSERKSLSSVSSISSSSLSQSGSRSRSRSKSRSKHESRRYGRYRQPSGHSRRSRSQSESRGSRSRMRRSRSRSRDSKGRRWHQRSRSPQQRRNSPYRDGKGKNDRSKYQGKRNEVVDDPHRDEKTKWSRFRQEADKIERELSKQLKYHEKNPEKHPQYPDEWKKFWNRRYKELQAENKDPSKHDFKPEWIKFWNKRVKDLYEEEIKAKKEEWKIKLGLPDDEENQRPKFYSKRNTNAMADDDVIVISSPASEKNDRSKKDVTVADIKNTWKALTGSEIKDSGKRSPSPWEEQEPVQNSSGRISPRFGRRWQDQIKKFGPGSSNWRGRGGHRNFYHERREEVLNVVTVLRLVTALENLLGSLGPKVNILLAQSLALERSNPNSSNSLMEVSDNVVLFETVREKLKGQLSAGIVPRPMVGATRACIHKLNDFLTSFDRAIPEARGTPSYIKDTKIIKDLTPPRSLTSIEPTSSTTPVTEPVAVPGVGVVDKVAIAQQIAAALVAQGKTDVSQGELQQLINAVVGMAQASADGQEPVTAAAFVAQQEQNKKSDDTNRSHLPDINTADKNEESPFQMLLSTVTSRSGPVVTNEPRVSGLQLLQSAYDEKRPSQIVKPNPGVKHDKKPVDSDLRAYVNRSENMDGLSEDDLKTLLQNFKDLPLDEQQCLITYLKTIEERDPDRVERLRKYVNLGQPESKLVSDTVKSGSYSPQRSRSVHSGRLSPFSMRMGGINPSQEDRMRRERMEEAFVPTGNNPIESIEKMEDSDDDYSFEDIYAAASRKVKEREKAMEAEQLAKAQAIDSNKKAEDSKTILRETKEIIANLMGELPGKFMQKQSPMRDSPAYPNSNAILSSEAFNSMQQISTLGSGSISTRDGSGHPVPIMESSAHQPSQYTQQQQSFPNYESGPSYNNQYNDQVSYPPQPEGYQQGMQNYPVPENYNEGFTNYYNDQQPHYPPQQVAAGGYTSSYHDQSYPNQYNQSFSQSGNETYNQFPDQSSGYY